MNVTSERLPNSQVQLEITASEAEQLQAIEKAYRRLAREIQIPGFRKGKAPRQVIEQFYGRELFVEEANRKLMDELYRLAIEQEDFIPVGEPEVESIEPEPLVFTITVPVYPDVDPGPYAEVRIDSVDAAISDEDVENVIERLRLNQSPWIDPPADRKPLEGDQITVDLHIMDGDEEFQPLQEDQVFILGEANLLEELRSAIESLGVGESTTADILFAEDDDRYAEDDPRRGKTMSYNITLKGIKERDLLDLDDEFAKTYANTDTLQELRTTIRQNLHLERTREARTEAMNNITDKIAEGATLEIPEPMIDDAVQERLARLGQQLQQSGLTLEAFLRQSGKSAEDMAADIRPAAEQELRKSLILREIAERENLSVTDEELKAEIESVTSSGPQAEEMREAYGENEYLRSALRNEMFDQRLTNRLMDIASDGKGAVLNEFVAPDAGEEPADGSEARDEGEVAATSATADTEPADVDAESEEDQGAITDDADSPAEAVAGDGSAVCPDQYPVKGNASSKIYHVEGDSSYEATVPEWCFTTPEAAEANGYRPTAARAKAQAD